MERITKVLEGEGFAVVSYADTKSCVDLIARRGDELLLIRVLGNIDALREESAKEFLRLAAVLRACPIIVGTHSKRGPLGRGVMYRRYSIPAVSLETFEAMVRGDLPEVEEYRGRRLVRINARALRKRRMELGYTLHQLADVVGTTKESIYRYERGQPLQESMAIRLERVLNVKLRVPVNPLGIPPLRESGGGEERFEPLRRVLDLQVFERTPWDALSGRTLMISEMQGNVYRRAELLKRGRYVVARYVALYGKEGREKVGGVPVITPSDLETVESRKDLFRLIGEKDEEG